jgi:ribosomal protein S7
MSRRRTAKKRIINPDPIYNSDLVSMIINRILVKFKLEIIKLQKKQHRNSWKVSQVARIGV